MQIDRRDFLKLAGIGGVVFVSGLGNLGHSARASGPRENNFFFVQLSDTHWGFNGLAVNPDSAGTLKKGTPPQLATPTGGGFAKKQM